MDQQSSGRTVDESTSLCAYDEFITNQGQMSVLSPYSD
jgi:hypothetical protein